MSMVHASRGGLKPASRPATSEPAIIAGLARATMPDSESTGRAWSPTTTASATRSRRCSRTSPTSTPASASPAASGCTSRPRSANGRRPNEGAFRVQAGVDEDDGLDEHGLILTTIRSHDQYNTTIYGLDDRYRGITGRRDIVFVHADDLKARGLSHGDLVDVEAIAEGDDTGRSRVLHGLTAVEFEIARNSAAAYYPEANPLVALQSYDARSGTPAYKSIPVRVRAAATQKKEPARELADAVPA